ncbi:hypothetical protein JCM15519_24360 [Fundidesulfovibrio butyratiphilus]
MGYMNVNGVGGYGSSLITPEKALSDNQSPTTAAQGKSASSGDTVSLSAQASVPRSAFNTDDEYNAYQSVIAQAQSDPNQIVNAHSGLDTDRVYRLLGLIE